jgi:hypothetical protein
MSIYAGILCMILLLLGQGAFAMIALIGCSLYGFIDCIKQYSKKRKNEKELENVSENIREIIVCHIVNRHPKLKKSNVEKIKSDIINSNYQVKFFYLTDKTAVVSNEPDGGIDYYLTFDNTDKYHVLSIVYDNAHIGDTLYIVTTPTDVIKVIRSKNEYFNMFTY